MKSDLIEVMDLMKERKILVIGDLVADVYLNGIISRVSREAPVLVLEQADEQVIAGGAANVVHNAATLGGRVAAVGLVGDDRAGEGLKEILAARGVNLGGVFVDPERATITKTRIIAGGAATVSQQIVRVDRETKVPLGASSEAKLMRFLEEKLPGAEAVVLSDYGGGALTQSIVKMVIYHAKKRGIPTVVDSRYRILDFAGVDFVKQNEAELAKTVGFALDNEERLLDGGMWLLQKMAAKGVLITRGGDGMTLFEDSGAVHTIPVTNRSEVFDVSGAGDTCVAALALALAGGAEPVRAAEISNFASGIAVRKLGTAIVTAEELKKTIGADSDGAR